MEAGSRLKCLQDCCRRYLEPKTCVADPSPPPNSSRIAMHEIPGYGSGWHIGIPWFHSGTKRPPLYAKCCHIFALASTLSGMKRTLAVMISLFVCLSTGFAQDWAKQKLDKSPATGNGYRSSMTTARYKLMLSILKLSRRYPSLLLFMRFLVLATGRAARPMIWQHMAILLSLPIFFLAWDQKAAAPRSLPARRMR